MSVLFRRLSLSVLFLLVTSPCRGSGGGDPVPLLFDVKTVLTIGLDDLVERLRSSRVIVIGERHNSAEDHDAQFQVIERLHAAGFELAVALETFGFGSQPRLDEFHTGRLSDEDLRAEFGRVASPQLFPLYQKIFAFCRDNRIPIVGIRAETDVLLKLYFKGTQQLTPEDLEGLPGYDPLCAVAPRYAILMRAFAETTRPFVFGQPDDQRLCAFFMGLDSVMGFKVAEYAKANPSRTMVVLVGVAHAWKTGVPFHVARNLDAKTTVILPTSAKDPFLGFDVFTADADYVWWHQ